MSELTTNSEEDGLNLALLWSLFRSKWYWFAGSLALSLILATVYLVVTPPVYQRTATLLIKDDSKDVSSIGNLENFSNMGLFKSNTNIQNEMLILNAPIMMQEVVSRLGLESSYIVSEKFRKKDLYAQSPVVVELDAIGNTLSFSFVIDLKKDQQVKLSQFIVQGEGLDCEPVTGRLSDTLRTPIGSIVVKPTPFYLGKSAYSTITFSRANTLLAAAHWSSVLKVELGNKNATVLNLTLQDVSTQRAEDILKALISLYNENWIEDKNQITISTSNFIEDRLQIIERELSEVDGDISSYKSANLLPDVQAVSQKYMEQSTRNETQLLELTTQLAMARYIRDYLLDLTTRDQLLPVNSGLDTKTETQIAEYNKLLLQCNNLRSNSSDKNPLVIDLSQSLVSMRQAITRSIDDLVAVLKIQIDQVSQSSSQTRAKIASNPNQVKYLLSVERQQKIKEALYLFLLQKREENALSQAFTAYNTKLVNPPQGKSDPISPKRNMAFMIAFVLGLLLPAGILFVIENLVTVVRGRKDLEALTIPFLGEIPQTLGSKKKEENHPIVIEEKSRNYINEAFRIVRTNVDFMLAKSDQGSVIMTTSIQEWSGKTFITMNLALSMAIKGARVIVLDADLRKATFSVVVKSPKSGLSDYLNGNVADLKEIEVKGILHPNLTVLPVGTIPPNPSELLLNSRFEALLTQLRTQYDYIFLDCPPIEIVADTLIIGRNCDLSLFIIRAGLFDRRLLPDVEAIYTNKQLNNMAIILNSVECDSSRSGYHKYGYHKYGYHKYGYQTYGSRE